jgi:hypothetical protein
MGVLNVAGTMTVNAGTNLNTSALALESGGNLATIAGDTTSIDGKITTCNTGAVVVSSGNITTSLEGRTVIKKTVDPTASQTAQTIWDPTAGKKFVITSIVIGCTTAGIITLFDETNDTTNRIAKLDMDANTNGNIIYPLPQESSTADNILKYTTGSFVGYLTVYGYEL